LPVTDATRSRVTSRMPPRWRVSAMASSDSFAWSRLRRRPASRPLAREARAFGCYASRPPKRRHQRS